MSISKRGCLRRRTFLPLLGTTTASIVLSACQGTLVHNIPTPALLPPTPADPAATHQHTSSTTTTTTSTTFSKTFQIPQAPPGLVAQTYLDAWNANSYTTMYQLITPEAQHAISQEHFVQRYEDIAIQATIVRVQATLDPGQRIQANQQHFTVTFDTILVGTIKQTNTLTLAVLKDGKTWRIQWLPSLIFTQLSGNDLIHMEPKGTPRGPIFDRHGASLATLGTIATVYLKPADVQEIESVVAKLAKLLKLSPAAIRERFVQAQVDVSIPLRNLTPAQLAPIRSSLQAIPGVYILEGPARVYPNGKTACQTIGYVSTVTSADLKTLTAKGYRPGDIIGRLGIERWGEPYLAGQWGGTLAVVTPKFNPVTIIAQRAPNKAGSVHLTIDLALQQHCEAALSRHRGAIAVMNSADGSLLAVASSPRFNPNDFILGITPATAYQLATSPFKPLVNRPVAATYPPGQLFQPVTAAAALEKAGYTPNVSFYCSGTYINNGMEWHCWKPGGHGRINLEEAIAQTCDVAAYTMGAALNAQGAAVLSQFATACGFGVDLHITGADENPYYPGGLVPNPAWKSKTFHLGWLTSDSINLADGRGHLLVTPAQLLTFYAALANGGTLWKPRLVSQATNALGKPQRSIPPTPLGQLPISPLTLSILRNGLEAATSTPLGRLTPFLNTLDQPAAGTVSIIPSWRNGLGLSWGVAYLRNISQPWVVIAVVEIEHAGLQAATLLNSILKFIGGTQQSR